jgi:hypothetical protein
MLASSQLAISDVFFFSRKVEALRTLQRMTNSKKFEKLIFCHSRENGKSKINVHNPVFSINYVLSGFPPQPALEFVCRGRE